MDKTFLHSKPHISQYTSFLMNHFLQMTVFEGSKLSWKRKFFIKKCIFYFHTCDFLLCYPSHCLCSDILCIVRLYEKHFSSLCSAPCFILIYLSVLHVIWHTLPSAIILLPLCCRQRLETAEVMGKVVFAEDYLPAFFVSGNL